MTQTCVRFWFSFMGYAPFLNKFCGCCLCEKPLGGWPDRQGACKIKDILRLSWLSSLFCYAILAVWFSFAVVKMGHVTLLKYKMKGSEYLGKNHHNKTG